MQREWVGLSLTYDWDFTYKRNVINILHKQQSAWHHFNTDVMIEIQVQTVVMSIME